MCIVQIKGRLVIMDKLQLFLSNISPGPISDKSALESLLMHYWDGIDGSSHGGMKAYKLAGRIEEPTWKPPVLSFIIERHGGTVQGSSRAELQRWTVDIDNRSAEVSDASYRQLEARQPSWTKDDAAKIVLEVSNVIRNSSQHQLVSWLKNGGAKVMINQIVPNDAAKQTVVGRRKRYWKLLDEELAPDWCRTQAIYKRVASSRGDKL
jgi:hypothetical protein